MAPAPAPAPRLTPPAPSSVPVSGAPTLGQSIKQGFGFGMGSAIAHRIFGASPTIVVQPTPAPTQAPTVEPKYPREFEQCMRESNNDREVCKQFLA